jgi:integrase
MIAITKVEPYLWPRPTSDGLYPVVLNVAVKKRGRAHIPFSFSVDRKYWDDKRGVFKDTHPEAAKNNAAIALLKEQVSEKINRLTVEKRVVDAKTLKGMVMNKKDSSNFFQFVEEYLKEVAQRVDPGTITEYERYANIVEAFHGSKELTFDQFNREFLKKYEAYLKKKYTPYSVKTQWNIVIGWVRKAFERGIIKELACTDYPAPTGEAAEKDYFSASEIRMLEEFADKDPKSLVSLVQKNKYKKWDKFTDKRVSRLINSSYSLEYVTELQESVAWALFGCTTGLRISDWPLFNYKKQVIDGEVRLRAKKNGGFVSLPIVGPVKRTLERIGENPCDTTYHTLRNHLSTVVKILGIDKHISPHCTRKSFATTMCASRGINVDDCADLMGITVAICKKNYYRVTDHDRNQRAAEKWKDL